MEKQKVLGILNQAVSESVEGIAFVEFDNAMTIDSLPASKEMNYVATIALQDPFSGVMHMIWEKHLTKEVVDSIYGAELEIDFESTIIDTLNEIINTVAGRFLAHVDENQQFMTGLPNTYAVYNTEDLPETTQKSLICQFNYGDSKLYCIISDSFFEE